jgi:F-type H+-transporting ATPase subunit b
MQIDWLTVAAQWINFLILMWLLQRFLYRPIVRAMDMRQQSIQAQIAEADDKARQAEAEAESFRRKSAELDAHRNELIAAARAAADSERDTLIAQARAEAETLGRQWRQELHREQLETEHKTRQDLARMVTTIACRALQDLCSLEMQQALLSNFLRRLQNLDAEQKRLLAECADGELVFASSFEPDETQSQQIKSAVEACLERQLCLSFQTLNDSRCGLMLAAPSYTLEWRIEQYFADLNTDLIARLAQDEATTDAGDVQ